LNQYTQYLEENRIRPRVQAIVDAWQTFQMLPPLNELSSGRLNTWEAEVVNSLLSQ